MPRDSGKKPAELRTRQAIIDILKREGPQDAATLAGPLGLSAMAVRQHLYALNDEGLVTYEEQPRPLGRPAKLWRLTAAADSFFPNGHAELTIDLIQAMKLAFGDKGLDQLLAVRSRAQVEAYGKQVKPGDSLPKRLAALARLRTVEGYMAEAQKSDDGGYLLVENHCPICSAAAACTGLCRAELEVFKKVLGDDVKVERSDHILAGARRCAYRVTLAKQAKA